MALPALVTKTNRPPAGNEKHDVKAAIDARSGDSVTARGSDSI
jgi:hypothetical protein